MLVVEDGPQARATAVGTMREIGCEIFDAYNASQALDILHAHPDLTA